MKQVTMTLEFRVTPDQERQLIERARSIKDAYFEGDDDLRDAIHNLVYELTCPTDKSDMLMGTFHGMQTVGGVGNWQL